VGISFGLFENENKSSLSIKVEEFLDYVNISSSRRTLHHEGR
jgi:hypothetical protein